MTPDNVMKFFRMFTKADLPDPTQSKTRFEQLEHQQFKRGVAGSTLVVLLVAWASIHGWNHRARAEQEFAIQAAKAEPGTTEQRETRPAPRTFHQEGMPTISNYAQRPDCTEVTDERRAEVRQIALESSLAFAPRNKGPGFAAKNRYSQFAAVIHGEGAFLSELKDNPRALPLPSDPTVEEWSLQLRFSAWGRGEGLAQVEGPIKVVASDSNKRRVDLTYPNGITEWYINDRGGLEQGFTIEERPNGTGALVLEVSLLTDLKVEEARPGQSLEFRNEAGRLLTRYDQLHVFDATGRELEASMRLSPSGDAVRLITEDGDAVYPLTVDPVIGIQVIENTASDGGAGDMFGASGSGCEDVVMIGAYKKDGGRGAVYLYLENQGGPGNWGEADILMAPDGDRAANDHFGQAIKVWRDESSNTMYAAIGAPGHGGCGAVFIFKRLLSGNWQFLIKLVGDVLATGAQFGISLAALGTLVVVGAYLEAGRGAVYAFRVNEGGVERFGRTQRIADPDGQNGDEFGRSLTLTSQFLGIAAPGQASARGAVFMYQLILATLLFVYFTTLFAQDRVIGAKFGFALAMVGYLIAIGAPEDDVRVNNTTLVNAGSVTVFQFVPALLIFTLLSFLAGPEANALFGFSVILSVFLSLVIGSPGATSRPGIVAGAVFVYLFDRIAHGYVSGDKIIPSTFIDPGMFLGSAIVLLGPVLFVAGMLYNFSMGAMFRFLLFATILTFAQWMLLFFTPAQMADPELAARLSATGDWDGDGIPNLVEFVMGLIPVLFDAGPSGYLAAGQFVYYLYASRAVTGHILVLQYALSLGTWFVLALGPLAGMLQPYVYQRGIARDRILVNFFTLIAAVIFMRVLAQQEELGLP